MTSLLSMMPAPSRAVADFQPLSAAPGPKTFAAVPPYLKRKGFVPRKPEDFGDGGAFPEIHVSQYPLNMGRPKKAGSGGTSSAIVAVDVDADGEVKYDAIVKQGTNRDRTVYTSLKDMKAKEGDDDALRLPSNEDEALAAERTRLAIGGIVGAKVAASKPFSLPSAPHSKDAKFISYNPNPNAPGGNGGKQQRIIRMVEEQVDPLEPAKFANKKVPRGPPEDPTPILHSPQRKTTVADQQAWKIPPCISNYKNVGGFTIPLDKRLAADGRGLQEQTINNNFASLSESLYIAERKAREQLEARSKITAKLKVKEKDQKEQELREIASKARMARAGVAGSSGSGSSSSSSSSSNQPGGNTGPSASSARLPSEQQQEPRDLTEARRDNRPAWMVERDNKAGGGGGGGAAGGDRGGGGRDDRRDDRREDRRDEDRDDRGASSSGRGEQSRADENSGSKHDGGDDDDVAAAQRDRLRHERRKEREREVRLENMKGEFKRSKHEKERERDVSEKIALGLAAGAPKLTGDGQFDSRLFNQSEGMSSGFGAEDDYNVYSKPLFDRGEAGSVYRPSSEAIAAQGGGEEGDDYEKLKSGASTRFKPDKGFRGADAAEANSRDGPVQFAKERKGEE